MNTYLRSDGELLVASAHHHITIALAPSEAPAVHIAAANLASDLADVCAGTATIGADPQSTIVIGTLESPLIQSAIDRGEIDLTPLLDDDGAPRWEAFALQATSTTLYIVGTDRRGAIYGIYDLCEEIGVSPWRWFADVPVATRTEIRVGTGLLRSDYPSVRYRGIFINDEEELEAWSKAHTEDDTIGPQTYARVFELLLRLKANHIWPAMHVNYFNGDPRNGELAEQMGIVVGTSHCDMLLRSNQNEWRPWLAEHEPTKYDYSIPGANRERLIEYWRGSIEQNRDYEVGWTVGMRGIHDSGFCTSAIDSDDALSEEAKKRARVGLLGQVIQDQLALLSDTLGPEGEQGRLKTFVPYKEVLPLYDAGLELPDDVTIIWVDDNFGYIRRFPSADELGRSGGHGLYYHSSYWAPPPRSYLFISSLPLAHMKNELRKAWDRGIRTLWINNTGAIKPLEQDVEFFLRYAWEVGKETSTADVTEFTADWVNRNFSGDHGAKVAGLYDSFAQITNVRKVEHLTSRVFSQTAYGDEAARRLADLRALYDQVTEILLELPTGEQETFFQLVAMKMHASYLSFGQFVYGDRSTLAFEQGKMRAADHYLSLSRTFEAHLRALLDYYNHRMSGGKWDRILTPEDYPPPVTAMLPAARPALQIEDAAGLGVSVWGQAGPGEPLRLRFSPYDAERKWIEVFPTGARGIDVTVTAPDWLGIECGFVHVPLERRICVWVTDPSEAAGRRGQVVVRSGEQQRVIEVTVDDTCPARPTSVVEADGVISLLADRPSERRDGPGIRWESIPHLGRNRNALLQVRGQGCADLAAVAASAMTGYQVYLRTPGAHVLELHRFPSLDSTGRIRVGVGVDDRPPVVLESATTDEHRGVWFDAIADNVEKLRLRLPYLRAGEHTLRLYAIDEYVAFSKAVIYTGEVVPCALGPAPSITPSEPAGQLVDPDPAGIDLSDLERVRRELYRVELAELPPRPVIYAPADYWSDDSPRPENRVAQPRLGPARFTPAADGTKDVLAAIEPGLVGEIRPGVLAIEAERALLDDPNAYRTASLDAPSVGWVHTQAETDGRTGLAMHVDVFRRQWADPRLAPGLHYRIEVTSPGRYHAWVLVKFDGPEDDSCALALDGTAQPISDQFCGGNLYRFGLQQVWTWAHLSDLRIGEGAHTLSILARKSRLRIDRLYLTLGEDRPPVDADWPGERVIRLGAAS